MAFVAVFDQDGPDFLLEEIQFLLGGLSRENGQTEDATSDETSG
jgi:hypothetical protein